MELNLHQFKIVSVPHMTEMRILSIYSHFFADVVIPELCEINGLFTVPINLFTYNNTSECPPTGYCTCLFKKDKIAVYFRWSGFAYCAIIAVVPLQPNRSWISYILAEQWMPLPAFPECINT